MSCIYLKAYSLSRRRERIAGSAGLKIAPRVLIFARENRISILFLKAIREFREWEGHGNRLPRPGIS
jgi:hypothetical protein